MRILIIGGDGMLGHQLLHYLHEKHEVKVSLHQGPDNYTHYHLFNKNNAYYNIDVRDAESLQKILKKFMPTVVINAAGIVKQQPQAEQIIPCLEINALFPHRLSQWCKEISARLIHISTDCIFNGIRGNYKESDASDAVDLYGRSKFLGELHEPHSLTLRTSIIGLELARKKSLIEWFLSQKGIVKGYRKARYSGLTTLEFSRLIEKILIDNVDLQGVWHVASKPINKYELLKSFSEKLEREDVVLEPDDSFICDRSLCAENFNRVVGYIPPTWDTMLSELARQVKARQH